MRPFLTMHPVQSISSNSCSVQYNDFPNAPRLYIRLQRIERRVRADSFMFSPPFATAKAGDDFPFQKPSTTGFTPISGTTYPLRYTQTNRHLYSIKCVNVFFKAKSLLINLGSSIRSNITVMPWFVVCMSKIGFILWIPQNKTISPSFVG